jgi:hypothetical protein
MGNRAECPPEGQVGCMAAVGGYIVGNKMTANFSRFGFTFRYWRTIAGSAD